jgi:hypothetical protein
VDGRRRLGVVVVVPALTHREDAEEHVVATLVTRLVRPRAEDMAHRVDAPRDVLDHEEAREAAPQNAVQEAEWAAEHRRAEQPRDEQAGHDEP